MATTVVTAMRTETRLDDTLADVTVITRAQIDNLAPSHSVVDVLQRLAGGQISSNGGRGSTQSIYMRGTNGGHTLVLIDGVRYGSVSSGAPALENLPLEMIERIELVKGPASALYGSEAVGGVIQIFTKRGLQQAKPVNGNAAVTLGQNGHTSGSANLYGKQQGWDYQLGISRVTDHGFSVTNPKAGTYYNPDRDGFQQSAANVSLGYALNADWRVDGSLLDSKGRMLSDVDDVPSHTWSDLRTQVAHLKLTGKLAPHWTANLSVGRSKDVQENMGSVWGDNRFNSTQTEYKWENTITTPLGLVMAGVERLEQSLDSSTTYSMLKRHTNAAFVGLNGSQGAHTWQVNLRHDDNSQFGGFNTYGLAYGYNLSAGLRVFASHGKSMRAPTFNDLYYFDGPGSIYNGNPHLQPEQAHNNEVGAEWTLQAHKLKLIHFDNRVSDLIANASSGRANVPGTTRLQGWSLDYDWQHAGWNLMVSYSYLDAKQADGQMPIRRAKNQGSVNLSKQLGAWQLGGNALLVGHRWDSNRNTQRVRLNSYATVDAYVNYQMTPAWMLQLRVANLTNRDYETAYGFNQQGRAAYITLKWAPK